MGTAEDVLGKCRGLPWQACLALYSELQESAPAGAGVVAQALREKARAGELPPEVIPVLAMCLLDARGTEAPAQLAKALAAFGREAAVAEGPLITVLDGMAITSDEAFWTFDGCLHALSYVGGDAARRWVEDASSKSPSPVARSSKVYKGAITADDRDALFRDSLEAVRRRLGAKDPGERWMGKATQRQASRGKAARKTAPWMTRGGG